MTLQEMNTQKERFDKAFALVADPADWKAPIHKVLHPEDLDGIKIDDVVDAIEFFTATRAALTPVEVNGTILAVLVTADGYRRGPAGG